MDQMKVIEVENLTREYCITKGFIKKKRKIIRAVDGVTFDVKSGEIFGLLGQNGAGKTTIIKILTTLLAPTNGYSRVFGYDTFGEEKKIRPRINFVFGGETGVYKRLSARDNLKYFSNLYLLNSSEQEKKIDKILDYVGLLERANDLAETFSKGMLQRLQIARGLINDPEIIFMDEPTIGLDPLGARMLKDIIKQLKAEGRTVLITTHYLAEAEELCDRMIIMNKGKIISSGTVNEIKGEYSSLEDAYLNLVQGG